MFQLHRRLQDVVRSGTPQSVIKAPDQLFFRGKSRQRRLDHEGRAEPGIRESDWLIFGY